MSVVQMPQADDFSRRVGAEIRAMMARSGVSQVRMTRLLGVNQTGVSKRLRGVVPIDLNELVVIARFFGVSPADIVRDAERPRPEPGEGGTRDDLYAARESNPQPAGSELPRRRLRLASVTPRPERSGRPPARLRPVDDLAVAA